MPAPPSSSVKAANDRAIAAAKQATASRSSAPNAAAAAASARLNSGNAGRATPSGVGNQMGNGRSMTTTRTVTTNTRSAPMGFSNAQFGNQKYSPGQMYSDPARSGAALRSVVNGINLMGGSPQQRVDAMLRNMGYDNPAARAGMIGNFAHESMNFNPDVLNGKIMGDNRTAFGMAQWRGDRLQNLAAFMKDSGLPVNSLAGQTAFAGTELPNRYKQSYAKTMAATTPAEAAAAMLGFERPAGYNTFVKTGDPSGVAGWNDRLAQANAAYGTPSPAATPASSMIADGRPPVGQPAGTPQPASAPGASPSFWESAANYAKKKGQDALQAYQQGASFVNSMPGSPAQKAAAISGYAKNGVLGGAMGYLTGGGVKGSPQAATDGSGRNIAERVRTPAEEKAAQNNPDFRALSFEDQNAAMKYIRQGYSVAEAIAKVKGTSGGSTTPPTPAPAWTPPTFITRPYTRVV